MRGNKTFCAVTPWREPHQKFLLTNINKSARVKREKIEKSKTLNCLSQMNNNIKKLQKFRTDTYNLRLVCQGFDL